MLRCSDKGQLLSLHPAMLSPEFQPDGRRSLEKSVEMDALAHERGFHRFEWTHRKLDGEEFPVEVTLTPVTLANRPVLLIVWHDLTERKRAEEQIRDHAVVLEFQKRELERANAELASLAITDGLTGLKNHRACQERLAEEVGRAARNGTPLSLVLLDVDHFKQLNDTHGHPEGDAVLKAVARILQGCTRDTDIVARYGGEEFVLILPQTDRAAAAAAERTRSAVEDHPWPVRPVTASFGVAVLRLRAESGTDLIARADAAMYQSKREGRNRVTCHLGRISPAGR
jgi:diguanylate cyclase (GGDEF)-like protein